MGDNYVVLSDYRYNQQKVQMYIIFNGKGCENCPFASIVLTFGDCIGDVACSLSELRTADGTSLPKIEANYSYKPKNCPFFR